MKASELKEVDTQYHLHLLAFLNYAVKAQRKSGKNKTKPVYKRFEQFFDYKKEIDKVSGKKSRFSDYIDYLKRRE